jgi:hypothetical protein
MPVPAPSGQIGRKNKKKFMIIRKSMRMRKKILAALGQYKKAPQCCCPVAINFLKNWLKYKQVQHTHRMATGHLVKNESFGRKVNPHKQRRGNRWEKFAYMGKG